MLFSKFVESYYRWAVPMKKHGMVPDHSFFEAMSSCLVAILPDKFYNKVEQGSIILKKGKEMNFCREGLVVDNESSPIKCDVVILATGYRGDQKMREIFTSPMFRDMIAGSPSSIFPYFRYKLMGMQDIILNMHACR
jgi:dimethylaniline monooxygenase (N-oxide forming)